MDSDGHGRNKPESVLAGVMDSDGHGRNKPESVLDAVDGSSTGT